MTIEELLTFFRTVQNVNSVLFSSIELKSYFHV